MANTSWTRRTFVQTLGALTASTSLETKASAVLLETVRPTARFAFAASPQGAIHVFAIQPARQWKQTQSHPSVAPAALALSPDRRFLYVANAIDIFDHRPTGSVEAYAINPNTGAVSLLNRQPLALSATMPSHLAVSPNGRQLAVATPASRSCNLLPLAQDGSIGRVTASIKCLGTGADAAPRFITFNDDRTLLASATEDGPTLVFELFGEGALRRKADRAPRQAIAPPTGIVFL